MTADRTAGGASDRPAAADDPARWAPGSVQDEVVRQSIDALIITDSTFTIRTWNPAAELLYGYSADDALGQQGQSLLETFDDTGEPIDPRMVRRELAASGVWRQRFVQRPRSGPRAGQEVTVDSVVTVLRGPDGESIGTLAINRDVTAAARRESELAVERTRMQVELVQAQKMEAIGLLVAGVAHELNNPLAAIVGFSHLLRTDPNLPADLRNQADLLVQEANRTRVIVQNLLDFARLRPPERVAVELRPLLDSVLGLQAYVLTHNRVTVDIDVEPGLPPLSIDRAQIQQTLLNLTFNAAQAIRELDRPGTIRIHARTKAAHDGPVVRIEIADNGPGIPPAIVDRLFVPFVTTREPGAGAGLGLSVSYGIVASHGGTLRHEPNADGGATFIIELPAGRGEDALDRRDPGRAEIVATSAWGQEIGAGAAAPVEDAGDPAANEPRKLRILVLDDEASIRELLGRLLSRSGHEPILSGVGAEALAIVERDPPDAILCDYRMAGMPGTEFHAAVMAIAPQLARRFAFMSGDVLNPELREFAGARGIQLLAKPFDIAAITSIVASLVEPASGSTTGA